MITFKVEGGKELAAALAKLPLRLSKRMLRDGLTEAAEPMVRAARAHAARRAPAPDIADNIGVSTAKTEDQAAIKVGPVKGFAYGLPLELGTAKMSPKPFLRPAFDTNAQRAIGIMNAAIWRELAGKGIQRAMQIADRNVEDLGRR